MERLSTGDFLYQSDQELFLVVTGETENSYQFAVHGWREIDKDRVQQYITDTQSKVHRQDEVEQLIKSEGNDTTQAQFNRLTQLFKVYEQAELPEDGPHTDFKLQE